MILVLLLGLALAGIAVVLIGRAFVHPRGGSPAVSQIKLYSYVEGAVGRQSAPLTGLVERAAESVGERFARSPKLDETRRQLVAAGFYQVTPRTFLGYRVLATVAGALAWLWLATTLGIGPLFAVLGAVACAAAGWIVPLRIVKDRAARRLREIDYELPELIDLLVVTVEAGIAFVASLQMAAPRLRGALGEEIRLSLQEQNMGLSINEALANLMARCETPSVRSFVRSILQGERLGVSIGQILRDLAAEMRSRRRQHAEERAQKAPIKILFPLVFLIFPAMFIVLLGPAVAQFLHSIRGA